MPGAFFVSGPSELRECTPTGLGDPKADDFDPAAANDHALGLRSREPGIDQIDPWRRTTGVEKIRPTKKLPPAARRPPAASPPGKGCLP
jgi:hypothetical protein